MNVCDSEKTVYSVNYAPSLFKVCMIFMSIIFVMHSVSNVCIIVILALLNIGYDV